MKFKKYIKAVGTGVKGNRDLEEHEIIDATKMILEREASDSQIGAFLIAWRVKLETNDELKAMVKALKSYITPKKIEDSIELGYAFDGKDSNPFLFPLYENILKNFYEKNPDIKRLNLVISGDLPQPAKNGICTKDIFDNLDKNSFEYLHFFDRKDYLKKLSELTNLRHELGLRTAFNTVEKLLNPALSDYAITTAFHKPYVKKYIDIHKDDYKDVFVIKGAEGSPEIFSSAKYWKLVDDEIQSFDFEIEAYGITEPQRIENMTLDQALEIVNNPNENIIKLAKFNVAMLLFLTNRVSSLDEAWEKLN